MNTRFVILCFLAGLAICSGLRISQKIRANSKRGPSRRRPMTRFGSSMPRPRPRPRSSIRHQLSIKNIPVPATGINIIKNTIIVQNPQPQRGAGHRQGPRGSGGRGRSNIPSIIGQGHGNNPFIAGQRHGNNPFMAGRGHGNNPFMAGQGHGNNPFIVGQGRGNNPFINGQGHGNNPFIAGQGQGNNPSIAGQGHSNNPINLNNVAGSSGLLGGGRNGRIPVQQVGGHIDPLNQGHGISFNSLTNTHGRAVNQNPSGISGHANLNGLRRNEHAGGLLEHISGGNQHSNSFALVDQNGRSRMSLPIVNVHPNGTISSNSQAGNPLRNTLQLVMLNNRQNVNPVVSSAAKTHVSSAIGSGSPGTTGGIDASTIMTTLKPGEDPPEIEAGEV